MDSAIKAAIARKRGKSGMDASDYMSDDEDHKDLAPDVKDAHGDMNGHRQNVHPSHDLPIHQSDKQDMDMAARKPLRTPTLPNKDRLMAGDGSDPQHDQMGVDVHQSLMKQDSPSNMKNHVKTQNMKASMQDKVGQWQDVDMSDPGPGDSDTMKTGNLKMKESVHGADDLPSGIEDSQLANHHGGPLLAARARMNSKFNKRS